MAIDATGAHQVCRRIAQRWAAVDILNTVEERAGVALQGVPGCLAKGVAQTTLCAPGRKWIRAVQTDLGSGLMCADTLAQEHGQRHRQRDSPCMAHIVVRYLDPELSHSFHHLRG